MTSPAAREVLEPTLLPRDKVKRLLEIGAALCSMVTDGSGYSLKRREGRERLYADLNTADEQCKKFALEIRDIALRRSSAQVPCDEAGTLTDGERGALEYASSTIAILADRNAELGLSDMSIAQHERAATLRALAKRLSPPAPSDSAGDET